MAKVSLRIYNREIEKLIEKGQLDEAIAHCRHILKTFSKYLETYRLLGKAYLEAKRYKEAVDIFKRILVAVPDDFVSHVGMSIINDDQNKLDDALWHMERAFEVQPSNAAIQSELQRLFGRRDGQEPPKIRLTRGALAHMYVQGELYNQAISEINAVLANDRQRTDMQVLLARAYFRNGQKNEATNISTQLLQKFVYCFDANRIMADLLPAPQDAESTHVFRKRVNELDPYAAFAPESSFRVDEVPDTSVNLEHFQYTDEANNSAENWDEKLGISLTIDDNATAPAQQPDWLKVASTPPPSVPSSAELPLDATPSAAPAASAEAEIPDFMRQAGWGQSSGQFDESTPVLDTHSDAGGAVQADLPDWIKAMSPEKADPVPVPSVSTQQPQPVPSTDSSDWLHNFGGEPTSIPAATAEASDGPSWLKELGEPVAASVPAASQASSVAPDWLKDLGNQGDESALVNQSPSQPQPAVQNIPLVEPAQDIKTVLSAASATSKATGLGDPGTSSKEQDDAMAWLENLASKHGAKAEELVTDPNSRTDVAPEWVDKARAVGETSTAQPASTPTPVDETGMWLRNLEEQESKSLANDLPASAETSDWLSGLSSQELFAAAPEKETPITNSDSAPDWLHGLTAKSEPAEPDETLQDFSFDANSSSNLPNWLAGLDNEQSVTPPHAGSGNDLPSWLQNDAEPEITEPANPADWHPVVQEPQVADSVSFAQQPLVREMDFEEQQPYAKPTSAQEKKATLPRLKQTSTPMPRSADNLESAQAEMERGNISTALGVYNKLIRKGKSLEEIIRNLRDALYRYPVEVSIWQALGDAYMRGSRLQEALDAYTKAEELLR